MGLSLAMRRLSHLGTFLAPKSSKRLKNSKKRTKKKISSQTILKGAKHTKMMTQWTTKSYWNISFKRKVKRSLEVLISQKATNVRCRYRVTTTAILYSLTPALCHLKIMWTIIRRTGRRRVVQPFALCLLKKMWNIIRRTSRLRVVQLFNNLN